ncbi:MAG: ASCH domain-containing protein [Nocardioides sp.]
MKATPPDRAAVAELWEAYVAATGVEGEPVDVFAFGDSSEQADELGGLVLHGQKRATAGLVADYAHDEDPLPRVGDHAVIVLGDGRPAAILCTTDVRIGPLSSVDEQFAWDEGEGDRSLAYWLDEHRSFFTRRCIELGVPFSEEIEVIFERFALVWPRTADRP